MDRAGKAQYIVCKSYLSLNSITANACKCVRRLGCHAGHQKMSRCLTVGEPEESMQAMKHVYSPWLWNPEQMLPEIQKQWYQWPHKRGLCPVVLSFVIFGWPHVQVTFAYSRKLIYRRELIGSGNTS